MKKTKHPYLKEILKTTAKVALIAGVTAVATPYLFGFATGLFNMMAAGYVAGGLTLGAGTLLTAKTLIKDVVTMRKRVKEQQAEEDRQARIERLREEVAKLREEYRRTQEQAQQDQPDMNYEPAPKQEEKMPQERKVNLLGLGRLQAKKRGGREAA